MPTTHQINYVLSEATALRLYNSVVSTNGLNNRQIFDGRQQSHSNMQQNSLESIISLNDSIYLCRICRWNRTDMEIIKCPCLCKGSVGFIHLQCLKRWIMLRGDNYCEICNTNFDIPQKKISVRRMLKAFFRHCAGPILKHLLFGMSLIPLTHIIMQQLVICIENISLSSNEQFTLNELVLTSSALLTSSASVFRFFEFITTRVILVRNILRHWLMFGNDLDFLPLTMETEIFDLFG